MWPAFQSSKVLAFGPGVALGRREDVGTSWPGPGGSRTRLRVGAAMLRLVPLLTTEGRGCAQVSASSHTLLFPTQPQAETSLPHSGTCDGSLLPEGIGLGFGHPVLAQSVHQLSGLGQAS